MAEPPAPPWVGAPAQIVLHGALRARNAPALADGLAALLMPNICTLRRQFHRRPWDGPDRYAEGRASCLAAADRYASAELDGTVWRGATEVLAWGKFEEVPP